MKEKTKNKKKKPKWRIEKKEEFPHLLKASRKWRKVHKPQEDDHECIVFLVRGRISIIKKLVVKDNSVVRPLLQHLSSDYYN